MSAPAKDLKIVSLEELAEHNKEGDAWIGVNGFVYNVGVFARVHPGGTGVLMRYSFCTARTLHLTCFKGMLEKSARKSSTSTTATWFSRNTTTSW